MKVLLLLYPPSLLLTCLWSTFGHNAYGLWPGLPAGSHALLSQVPQLKSPSSLGIAWVVEAGRLPPRAQASTQGRGHHLGTKASPAAGLSMSPRVRKWGGSPDGGSSRGVCVCVLGRVTKAEAVQWGGRGGSEARQRQALGAPNITRPRPLSWESFVF